MLINLIDFELTFRDILASGGVRLHADTKQVTVFSKIASYSAIGIEGCQLTISTISFRLHRGTKRPHSFLISLFT